MVKGRDVFFMTTTIYAVGHSAGFVLNVILREVLSINATFTTVYIDMYKITILPSSTSLPLSGLPFLFVSVRQKLMRRFHL